MIFVDTPVWSLVFRRRREQVDIPVINQLKALIEKDELLAVPSIVSQELLTGLKKSPNLTECISS
jgi:predicted nucleic acid-binding protein